MHLLETTLANALFRLDAVLPDRLLTHHNPPHGLVYIASRLKACDVSGRRQLCPTYPLELQSFHVQHTSCTPEVARIGLTAPAAFTPFGVV